MDRGKRELWVVPLDLGPCSWSQICFSGNYNWREGHVPGNYPNELAYPFILIDKQLQCVSPIIFYLRNFFW